MEDDQPQLLDMGRNIGRAYQWRRQSDDSLPAGRMAGSTDLPKQGRSVCPGVGPGYLGRIDEIWFIRIYTYHSCSCQSIQGGARKTFLFAQICIPGRENRFYPACNG